MSYQEWEDQYKSHIELQPKYGNKEKTKGQKEADQKFIESITKISKFNGDKKLASNHLINLGFQYLYGGKLDIAMKRFNQAYLLDNENTDIYWGFGAVYMYLSNLEKAKEQYEQGLKLDPRNTHLLTDYGTYFLSKYNEDESSKDKKYLNMAIKQLTKSYLIDQKNQNTLYKLSVCYLINGNCENAKKFYDLCKEEGGKPISDEYTSLLNEYCK